MVDGVVTKKNQPVGTAGGPVSVVGTAGQPVSVLTPSERVRVGLPALGPPGPRIFRRPGIAPAKPEAPPPGIPTEKIQEAVAAERIKQLEAEQLRADLPITQPTIVSERVRQERFESRRRLEGEVSGFLTSREGRQLSKDQGEINTRVENVNQKIQSFNQRFGDKTIVKDSPEAMQAEAETTEINQELKSIEIEQKSLDESKSGKIFISLSKREATFERLLPVEFEKGTARRQLAEMREERVVAKETVEEAKAELRDPRKFIVSEAQAGFGLGGAFGVTAAIFAGPAAPVAVPVFAATGALSGAVAFPLGRAAGLTTTALGFGGFEEAVEFGVIGVTGVGLELGLIRGVGKVGARLARPKVITMVKRPGRITSLNELRSQILAGEIKKELVAPPQIKGLKGFIEEQKLRKFPRFGVEKRPKRIDFARQQLLEREALETAFEKSQIRLRDVFELEEKFPQFKVEKPPRDIVRQRLLEREAQISRFEKGQIEARRILKLDEALEKRFPQFGVRKPEVKPPKPIDLSEFLRPGKKFKPFKPIKRKPSPLPTFKEIPAGRAVQIQIQKVKPVTRARLKTIQKQQVLTIPKAKAVQLPKAAILFKAPAKALTIPKGKLIAVPKAKPVEISKVKLAFVAKILGLSKVSVGAKAAPMQIPKSIAKILSEPVQLPKAEVAARARFAPAELAKLKILEEPRLKPKPKIRFKLPDFPKALSEATAQPKRAPGFFSEIKSKGKWLRFKGARPEKAAKGLAATAVDNSASRSWRVRKADKSVQPGLLSRFPFTPGLASKFRKGKKERAFVEKSKFAIDSFGELQEITAKGWAALRGLKLAGIPRRKKKRRKRR